MQNPCWPGGVHPHAKTKVKTEVKEEEDELPTDPRRGVKKIRVLEDPKPKVKVDKRILAEAKAAELKAKLVRRKEQFAAGRQSGEEDAKMRSRIEEHLFRGDAYAPDPRSVTASSSRVPEQGPKPPSGPPPKSLQPPPPKNIRKAIPAPPQIPQRSYAEASSKAAGATPASAATSDAEILNDSDATIAEDLCQEYS
jgi:hypothetical protein